MKMLEYLNKNKITCVGEPVSKDCVICEMITDKPYDITEMILLNGCYISEILWWHRVPIDTASPIGHGGPRDPRDPEAYYFAETDECKSFGKETSLAEYLTYFDEVKKLYSSYDVYPSFDVCRIT